MLQIHYIENIISFLAGKDVRIVAVPPDRGRSRVLSLGTASLAIEFGPAVVPSS